MEMVSATFASLGIGHIAARPTVVDAVAQFLLEGIHHGRLSQGQRLNDIKLAEEMGVSRTPVREALQRLRDIGVVEASPNRFTRVVEIEPEAARNTLRVWLALYLGVIEEVVPGVPGATIARMRAERDAYARSVKLGGDVESAQHYQEFFALLRNESANEHLRRMLNSVSHLVRLGWRSLPPAHPEHVAANLDRILDSLVEGNATGVAEGTRAVVDVRLYSAVTV
jgi:DNA-binding GntR family transcriptional regulator